MLIRRPVRRVTILLDIRYAVKPVPRQGSVSESRCW
jgi:hypothetical protein